MALVLDTTIAGAYSNSYVDIAYADSYWANHYAPTKSAQWAALSAAAKTSLLITATRIVETLRFTTEVRLWQNYRLQYNRRTRVVMDLYEDLTPVKSAFFQLLQFPRSLDRDPTTGLFYIPEGVSMAQCEQALYTLNFDDSILALAIQGVDRDAVSIGDIRTRQSIRQDGSSVAPVAVEFLRPFFLKTTSEHRRS